MAVSVTKIADSDMPIALELCVQSFVEDSLYLYMLPDPTHRAECVRTLFKAYFDQTRQWDMHYCVKTETDGIVSVAMEMPPDVAWPEGQWADFQKEYFQLIKTLYPTTFNDINKRFDDMEEWFDDKRSDLDVEGDYYLIILATRPDMRGKGLGALLLDHLTNMADKSQRSCYLECSNPSAAMLYKKHGFRVILEEHINGLPENPRLIFMQRPPQQSAK